MSKNFKNTINEKNQGQDNHQAYTLPIDHPSIVKTLYLHKKEVSDDVKAVMSQRVDNVAKVLENVSGIFKQFEDKRVVKLENNNDLWIDMVVGGIYLTKCLSIHHKSQPRQTIDSIWESIDALRSKYGFAFAIPTNGEILSSFALDNDVPVCLGPYFINTDSNVNHFYRCICTNDSNIHTLIGREEIRSGFDQDYIDYAFVPIARLKDNFQANSIAGLMRFVFSKHYIPAGISKMQNLVLTQFIKDYDILCPYLEVDDGLGLNKEKLLQDVIDGNFKASVLKEDLDFQKNIDNLQTGKVKIDNIDKIKKSLLEVDHKRAYIGNYPDNFLTDVNMGHWELFENKADNDDYTKIELAGKLALVARPPHLDIIDGGVCGIDFGTKSTVVACFETETRLQRIGKGKYEQAVTADDYQNPTVMQIIDFDAFMNAYRDRIGRPFTRWLDMTVSHQAEQELLNNGDDSSVYNSIFSELKQWANDKKRRLQLVDRKGKVIDIKPYLQLEAADFDPIEIYAYYLGLYINNMFKKIYLDYILSFPVNYEKEVRDKLLQSFTRGLKKSLPPSIIADIDAGKLNFRVYAGASEPAAYAVSALEFYHLEPQNPEDKVCYGVFDFGGGTTDFDFGIEEYCERKYQYQIRQFGKGGDVYLGGENILALMAYQVYKDNFALMTQNNIPIVIPPKGMRFAGSEALVFDRERAPREAFLNLKKLAETLRPIWENKPNADKLEIKSLKLYTLPKKGIAATSKAVNPEINREALDQLIERRIQDGVDSFFKAYIDAFADYLKEAKAPIHIFLAGNSSKHPKVKELFSNAIAKQEQLTQQTYQKSTGRAIGKTSIFVLHEPLHSTGENVDFELLHTGKTGVVFGLIRSRKGGDDVKILDMNKENAGGEILFPYYLGKINRQKVFECNIPMKIPYNQWCEFCAVEEDDEDFELYYTEQARCLEKKMCPNEVKKVSCKFARLTDACGELNVYIRKVKPDTFEYTICTEEELTSNSKKQIYSKTLLR